METPTVRVPLRGPYDLREVALMGFGHRDEDSYDGVMRLALCVDGDYESQVGVAVRQEGDVLTVVGQPVPVVPTPSRLLGVDQLPGLPADRIPRLHAIAEAAQRGDLAVDRLTALGVDAAKTGLQRLPGIGQFYSTLITVRACGLTDVLATEPQVLKHLEATYGRSVDAAELEQLAEAWRPWRTWAIVMLRALGGRTDPGEGDARG